MKKTAVVSVLVVALLLLLAVPPSGAFPHSRVVVGVNPFWWGSPHPGWYYPHAYYPYAYYPPVYVYPPPAVIVQQPPVYVQQQPPPAPVPAPPPAYWYYCASARGYYPTVQTCGEPWIKVPPRPE